MPYHDIKQGETLFSIALQYGLADWKVIAERPENSDFVNAYPDAGVLKPGTRVFVPNREMKHAACAVDARHTFNIPRKTVQIRLLIKDASARRWPERNSSSPSRDGPRQE